MGSEISVGMLHAEVSHTTAYEKTAGHMPEAFTQFAQQYGNDQPMRHSQQRN